MRILIAPDSFKGSLSATELCDIFGKAARDADPSCEVFGIPVADGGEGTVASILYAFPGNSSVAAAEVHDPLGRPITASYAIIDSRSQSLNNYTESISPNAGRMHSPSREKIIISSTEYNAEMIAVIEMAAASGLTLVNEEDRDVMHSSTYGTGELVMDAVHRGCRKIYIGIGGSATNDGGLGFAAAIGVRFIDQSGQTLRPLERTVPAFFNDIASIDTSGIPEAVRNTEFIIMSDVKNPLLGPNGATAVYGPQKGVTPDMVVPLDSAMEHYIDVVEAHIASNRNGAYSSSGAAHISIRNTPGAGAAGGLGAGILAFTNATINSGIETILDLTGFDELMRSCDLVITGEGKMDRQSAFGKVASGIGSRCKKAGVPCIAIVGCTGDGYEAMYDQGVSKIIATGQGLSVEESIRRAPELCYEVAFSFLSSSFPVK